MTNKNISSKQFKRKKNVSGKNNISSQINQELLRRYDNFFGKENTKLLLKAKNNLSKDRYIRVNQSKTNIDEILQFFKSNRVKYSRTFIDNCIKIEKSFFNLVSSLPFLTGKVYFQDIASQLPINCINLNYLKEISKREKRALNILDMAASPGSKTTQLCDLLELNNISYFIDAVEFEEKRIKKLINNIQKQEFTNVLVHNCDAINFETNKKYDLILLDAPCSGNLIDDKDWLKKRDVKGILNNSNLQKNLLKKAYSLLSGKGILIYSTCSLEPEENELNVSWFLRNFKIKTIKPNLNLPFDISPLKTYKNQQLNNCKDSIRIMPYKANTQGFYICCFTKSSNDSNELF